MEANAFVSSTALLAKMSLVMVRMSSVASRTVCRLEGGGTLNALLAFLLASSRNIPHRESSSMCFDMAFAPAACTPSFMILKETLCNACLMCSRSKTLGLQHDMYIHVHVHVHVCSSKLTDYNAQPFGRLASHVLLSHLYSRCGCVSQYKLCNVRRVVCLKVCQKIHSLCCIIVTLGAEKYWEPQLPLSDYVTSILITHSFSKVMIEESSVEKGPVHGI